MILKKWLITIFLCIFTMSIFAQSATPDAPARLDQLLKHTNTFQAHFSQVTISQNNRILSQSEGTMHFRRPNQFRWETTKPSHQIVIKNNQWLWVYDVDLKQATKEKVSEDRLTPASVLLGDTAELLKNFTVTMGKSGKREQFLLIAKNKETNFREVMIYFVDDLLTGLSVINPLGQKNRFSFSEVKKNVPLDSALFTFKTPQGVDLLQSQ